MGGNALKNTKTERKNKKEYDEIKFTILKILSEHLICDIIYEVPEKKDFGDLDVLYISNEKIIMKDLVTKLFNPNEIVVNGSVMSFDYNQFQIDLIKCPNKEYMNMAMFFYGYGDIGSIIGRICNHYGLKYGHEGLWANILDNTLDEKKEIDVSKNTTKLILSTDPVNICKFLEYDYKEWQKGFETKESIFKWLTSSKYFNADIFSVLNHEHYQRAIKRTIYMEFLKYINISSIERASIEKSYIKINLQSMAIKYFEKEKELEEIIKYRNKLNERKRKFNGKYLIELNIKQEEIGEIIKNFKEYIQEKYKSKFENWLDNTTHENIMDNFHIFYKN
jgi:hypothetical protein